MSAINVALLLELELASVGDISIRCFLLATRSYPFIHREVRGPSSITVCGWRRYKRFVFAGESLRVLLGLR